MLLVLLLALGAAAACAALILYQEFSISLPPVKELAHYRPPTTSRVYAADGTLLGEFYLEKRYLVPIYKIPRVVQLAFVGAEDADFYEHEGIDPVSIVRAAMENYRSGAIRQGGSTITQQLVKSLLLSPEKSYERKIKELVLAVRLEHELTKEEILYLYLNEIYLGNGAYGIQAAAQEYFGKDASELNLAEGALLAGLPQAPTRYSPVKHLDRAKVRQHYVLQRMVEEGFISPEEARQAEQQPIKIQRRKSSMSGIAPYFVEHVRRLLIRRYGADAAFRLGLDIYTTIDLKMQATAEEVVENGVERIDRRQGFRGALRRVPDSALQSLAITAEEDTAAAELPAIGEEIDVTIAPGPDGNLYKAGALRVRWDGGVTTIVPSGLDWIRYNRYRARAGDVFRARVREGKQGRDLELIRTNGTQAALMSMDPTTGDVKAMVGGIGEGDFNRATQARRQPGSSFKPLLYAAAMDRGLTPNSMINDAPVSYRIGGGKWWTPKNAGRGYSGPTSLRTALTFSRNVPTVKMVDQIGLKYVLAYLPHFGFHRSFPKNLSIALGTAEVTLEEMIEAYGVFPNLGVRVEPRYFTHMIDDQGQRIDVPVESVRAIPADTAYILTDIMRDVIDRGTGKDARIGRPAAGKTGTTNDRRDVWFIGFTPELVTGVWVGYDQDRTLGYREAGGKTAAPLWRDFMSKVLEDTEPGDFAVPNDVVLVDVNGVMQVREGRHKTLLTMRRPPAAGAKTGKPGEEDLAKSKAKKGGRQTAANRRRRAAPQAAPGKPAVAVPPGQAPTKAPAGQPARVAAPTRAQPQRAQAGQTRPAQPAPKQAQAARPAAPKQAQAARPAAPKQAQAAPARRVSSDTPPRSNSVQSANPRGPGAL